MKKSSLSLIAAGVMAVAGLAQADVIFYPDGTSVELGPNGADSLALSSPSDTTVLGAGPSMMSSHSIASSCQAGDSSCLDSQGMVTAFNDDNLDHSMSSSGIDTTVLGAGPATSTVTTTQYVYVQPNINWDRSTAMTQLHSNAHLMHHGRMDRTAAATFNTPTRAGEMSTMTSGAPNALTNNDRVIVGSYNIPYSSVNGNYYVFSY
jgi:hypothetical protein